MVTMAALNSTWRSIISGEVYNSHGPHDKRSRSNHRCPFPWPRSRTLTKVARITGLHQLPSPPAHCFPVLGLKSYKYLICRRLNHWIFDPSPSSASMARFLSQTLIRSSSSSVFVSSNFPYIPPNSSRLLNLRNRSNRSDKAQLIELELDSDASDGEVLGLRRLEDAIHGIIIRRSAPDWLPFVPGSSYWVPPRKRPLGVVELVGRLANPLSEEQTMSLTTVRGWPSAAYYIEGSSPQPVEKKSKKKTSQSEDEG